MGERKGQLKWYPPDFDPRKHKSLDAYHGSHPLRERARKLDKGILIIRFEMPYDIWCGGCGIHIAQSVRYNAEKSKAGMYYTTPIWKFRMRCHLCPQYFEIKTDPATHDYVITSGARRKEKRWDPKENEQIVTDDKTDIKKMNADAMFKLEHGTDDKAKLKAKLPGLAEIEGAQTKWKDDYLLNQQARLMFRAEKKQLKTENDMDADLLKKSSLDIALVKEHEDDVRMASLMKYSTVKTFDEKKAEKRLEIESRPLFSPSTSQQIVLQSPSTSSSSGSSSTTKVDKLQQIALTKKKLGIKPSKLQTNAFKDSQREGKIKSFTSSRLGIVVKKNTTKTDKLHSTSEHSGPSRLNEDEVEETGEIHSSPRIKTLDAELSASPINIHESLCDTNLECNKSEQSNEVAIPKSVGLGSLMTSYESSSGESD